MIYNFGADLNGTLVQACELRAGGTFARVLSWGATVQDYRVAGIDHSLVLGGETIDSYFDQMQYFGAIVGPVANRIAKGRMQINGETFELDINENGTTTLHSGCAGFSDRNWTFTQTSDDACELTLEHPDGLGGFPGNLIATVVYRLTASGALEVEISGRADADVFFSPAFHGYWNLSGQDDLSDHMLTVPAETYLPVDADQIPIGSPAPVSSTAFDYRQPRPIGPVLDHNFCLGPCDAPMQTACRVEASGIVLEVQTDQPGVQIYNGSNIDTTPFNGHLGRPYGACAGLAIEPQFWPDTPNQSSFPSSLLKAGQRFVIRSRFVVSDLRT
ncbi:aldose 1-epimerase [Sulfitobacter marinus]|uniref:Aldose 1-epimerase n=1 Tax=Sulfitobacter marinus TaxID=394264 RepID=A0A1I6VAE0_9RHOB|nr:aldose epimerase family protein [Sulfitobacter marinus]SFT10651.1 aldose 1-epimerase [Sulfitobacter marinus]